jgi:hypothetical protein
VLLRHAVLAIMLHAFGSTELVFCCKRCTGDNNQTGSCSSHAYVWQRQRRHLAYALYGFRAAGHGGVYAVCHCMQRSPSSLHGGALWSPCYVELFQLLEW